MSIIIIEYTKGTGSVISRTEEVTRNYKTDAFIKVTMSTASHKDWESTNGLMGSIMKENGSMDSNMDSELGMVSKEISMSGNGNSEKQTDRECIFGLMEIDTKDSSSNVLSMVKGHKSSQMEIYTLANSTRVNLMVMGNIIGQMGVITKGTLRKEKETATVYGKDQWGTVINTRDNTCKIRRKDMAFLLGMQAIFIRGIIGMTKEKDTGRCIGLMEATTKDTGTRECKKARVTTLLIIGAIYTVEDGEKKGVFHNNIMT